MGRRDYRRREPKKPKKDDKKSAATVLPQSVTVEVVKRGKKPAEEVKSGSLPEAE